VNWLSAFVRGLVRAVLDWWQDRRDQPEEMKDAKTPDVVRDSLNKSVDDFMRDKAKRDRDRLKRGLGQAGDSDESAGDDLRKRKVD